MRDSDQRPDGLPPTDRPEPPGESDNEQADATAQMPALKPGAPAPAQPDEVNEPDLPTPPPLDAPGSAAEAPDDEPDDEDEAQSDGEPDPLPAPEPIMAAPRVAIVRLSGADDGEVTLVSGGEITIGRESRALTIILDRDLMVSHQHATIVYRDGGWWLKDTESRNGTFLGASKTRITAPTLLTPGTIFRVGHTDLMLTDDPAYLSHGAIPI